MSINKKWIVMWEREPVIIFDSKEECEEYLLSCYEEDLYCNFYIRGCDMEKFHKDYKQIKKDARYGYWFKEVPYVYL